MTKKRPILKQIKNYQELEFLTGKTCIHIASYRAFIAKVKGFQQKGDYISCELEVLSKKEMSYNPFIDAEKGLEYEWKDKSRGTSFTLGLSLEAGSIHLHNDEYLQFSGYYAGGTTRLYFLIKMTLARIVYLILSPNKEDNREGFRLFNLHAHA